MKTKKQKERKARLDSFLATFQPGRKFWYVYEGGDYEHGEAYYVKPVLATVTEVLVHGKYASASLEYPSANADAHCYNEIWDKHDAIRRLWQSRDEYIHRSTHSTHLITVDDMVGVFDTEEQAWRYYASLVDADIERIEAERVDLYERKVEATRALEALTKVATA